MQISDVFKLTMECLEVALRSGMKSSLALSLKASLPAFENHLKEASQQERIKWRRLIAFSLYKNKRPLRCLRYITTYLV
jgi:hypothetical protein